MLQFTIIYHDIKMFKILQSHNLKDVGMLKPNEVKYIPDSV